MVIGAGMVGAATAWRLAMAGHRITLVDRSAEPHNASWASAGLLGPFSEAIGPFAEAQTLPLEPLMASLALWADWAELLGDIGYTQHGCLCVVDNDAWSRTDFDARRSHLPQSAQPRILSRAELARLDARISPPSASSLAILWPQEAQLAPRATLSALRHALLQAGGEFRLGRVARILTDDRGVAGVEFEGGEFEGGEFEGGEPLLADRIVLTGGAQAASLLNRLGIDHPIYPIKGQILALSSPVPALPCPLRFAGGYLVPKPDGRMLLGATMEPDCDDLVLHPQALQGLVDRLAQIAPQLARKRILDRWAGVRAGSRTNEALVQAVPDLPGLFLNVGHGRNGVLLAPHSAERICALIHENEATR